MIIRRLIIIIIQSILGFGFSQNLMLRLFAQLLIHHQVQLPGRIITWFTISKIYFYDVPVLLHYLLQSSSQIITRAFLSCFGPICRAYFAHTVLTRDTRTRKYMEDNFFFALSSQQRVLINCFFVIFIYYYKLFYH